MLTSILQDLRFAARQLRRAPFFSLSVMLTLALSIGATAALTGVLRATLLHPLPYPQANQLVTIQDENLRGFKSSGLVTFPRTEDLATLTANGHKLFSDLAFFYYDDSTLTLDAKNSFRVPGAAVSGNFFPTVAAAPLLGRTIHAADDIPNGPQLLVISYRLWQSRFAADPNVIGRSVRLGTDQATIIGVMPQSFAYPTGIDLFHPSHVFASSFGSYRGDGGRFVEVIARLSADETPASATAAVGQLATQLARTYPQTDSAWTFKLATLRDDLFGQYRRALLLLTAAVALVLIVAAVNIAGLQLSRNAARAPEFAIRSALGITRARLTRQLLTESLLLVLSGSFAGVALAAVLLRMIASQLSTTLLLLDQPRVDLPVLVLSITLAVAVSLFTAALPTLQARRHSAPATTRSVVSNTRILGKTFTTLQIAFALILLTLSASVLQSLYALLTTPLGFEATHLQTFTVDLPWSAHPEASRHLYSQLEESFDAIPGVEAAGSSSALPFSQFSLRATYDIFGQPPTPNHDAVDAEYRTFSPGYLRAMHIPLLAGRSFTSQDAEPKAPPILLINQTLAHRYFANSNPLGQRLTGRDRNNQPYTAEIVGIIGDVHGTGGSLSSPLQPEVYQPVNGYWPHMQFVLRTTLPTSTLEPQLRSIVTAADSTASLGDLSSLDTAVESTLVQPRLNASLLTAFAALSLLLVTIGVYGLVAFDVAQRTRELGLRLALGSSRGGVLALLLADSSRILVAGLAVGVVASLLASRLIGAAVTGTRPHMATLLLASSCVLTFAVLVATLLPSMRAARIEPIEALRSE